MIIFRGQRTENGRPQRLWVLLSSVSCLLFSVIPARATDSNAGTSGAAFLKIGPGARPAGMGEAFTGVADDIHSIYWNPAGLGLLHSPEITGMHMQYFQNIAYEFAAFAVPTAGHGTLGMAISNLHTDDIQRRTDDTDTSLGTFGASDSAYMLSYGKSVNSRLSLGATGKYIRQTIDSTDASAYAMDGGALYLTDWHEVRFGAAVQNLGSKVKFVNESDPLPLTYRLGASAPLLAHRLLVSSDLIIPRDHQVGLALGTEYKGKISKDLGYAMRAGYRSDTDVSGFSGVSIGSGLELGRGSLDFAWVPFGDLGNAYRFSLHVKFGPSGDTMDTPDQMRLKQAAVSPTDQASSASKSDSDAALEQLLSL
jgi:hypothetical protein